LFNGSVLTTSRVLLMLAMCELLEPLASGDGRGGVRWQIDEHRRRSLYADGIQVLVGQAKLSD
jgi:hypothetical protein